MATQKPYAELEDDKLVKLAKKREVEVTEETTREQIIAALEAQDAAAEAGEGDEKPKARKGDKVYYFIKSPVYASDDEIMQRGLYQFDEENPRLDKQGERYVQKFVGKVPTVSLVKIAELVKVNAEEYDEEELLEVLLTNPLS